MSVYCTCLSLLLLTQLCALGAARVAERSGDSGGIQFRSDYTFSQEAAGWLKLHRVPLDWHTAMVQCYHEGAVLASPLNANLSTALSKLLDQAELYKVYTGISSTLSDSLFSSVEGVALGQLYIEWASGQPNNNGGNQSCTTLTYNKDDDILTVNDETCTRRLPFICYRPVSAADKLTECGTVDKEYKLDTRTGHCYRFHRHSTTWDLAARACQAEGGNLAVIDSQAEADLLVELFAAHPPETLLYTGLTDTVSIGFSMRAGKWWTVDGERSYCKLLEENGYYNWNESEPNNCGGNQKCGGIIRNGRFDDVTCDNLYAFICEKTPESLLTTTRNLNDNVY